MARKRRSNKLRKLLRLHKKLAPITRSPRRMFTLAVIIITLSIMPGMNYYETLRLEFRPPLVRASPYDDFVPSLLPMKKSLTPPPYMTAESVIVVDQNSFVPLYQLNPRQRLRPASITKLMTALVALDYFDPGQVLTVKSLANVDDEADMGLKLGDQLTVKTLLYGLLVPSGNDAAYTLADNYPGGFNSFVEAMNKKAKDLHLFDTNFQNPSGLDSPEHYSTARDISLLTSVVLQNELIRKIVKTRSIVLTDVNNLREFDVKNVNQLLGLVYGLDGVKTGFTQEAGQCLVSTVSRNGQRIVVVLLKSQDRFGESANLIEWVYRNFEWVSVDVSS